MHIEEHLTYTIYKPVVIKERIHEYVSTDKIYTMLHEPVICVRGTKMEKGLLDIIGNINIYIALLFPGRDRDKSYVVQRTNVKEVKKGFMSVIWHPTNP